MPPTITENLAAVRARIADAAAAAGRDAGEITLIAVSKTKPAEAVAEAFQAGQRIFGENRVQEAVEKMAHAPPDTEWHLIGHLQSNKARMIPGRFAAVQTVDSEKVALALQHHAAAAATLLDVFLQINLGQEATKSGVENRAQLGRLAETVRGCGALRLRGLMTLPDPTLTEEQTRRHFAAVRELHVELRAEFGLGEVFSELSMGMSHDYALAISEGATIVRVGTAIFGARPEPGAPQNQKHGGERPEPGAPQNQKHGGERPEPGAPQNQKHGGARA